MNPATDSMKDCERAVVVVMPRNQVVETYNKEVEYAVVNKSGKVERSLMKRTKSQRDFII